MKFLQKCPGSLPVSTESDPCPLGGCSPTREVYFQGENHRNAPLSAWSSSEGCPSKLMRAQPTWYLLLSGTFVGALWSVSWECQSMFCSLPMPAATTPFPGVWGHFCRLCNRKLRSFWEGNEALLLEWHPCRASLPEFWRRYGTEVLQFFAGSLAKLPPLTSVLSQGKPWHKLLLLGFPTPDFLLLLITHPGKKTRALHSFSLIDTSISHSRWHLSCLFPWSHNADKMQREKFDWIKDANLKALKIWSLPHMCFTTRCWDLRVEPMTGWCKDVYYKLMCSFSLIQ